MTRSVRMKYRDTFDLFITDLMTAGTTGMDVFRATRKCHTRARAILITGAPSSQTPLEAKRQGLYAYLRKPFQQKQFLSILKDAIEHTRMRHGHQYQRGDERGVREVERGALE